MRWLAPCAVALLIVAACADDQPACFAGDFRGCTCPGTGANASPAPGYQACLGADGYGACVCDGTTPGLDASAFPADAGDAGADSALIPFMSPCDTNEQCETGLCFSFNQKGTRCSKPCKTNDECTPPSTGCNGQGVCKAP
jgi:hypothetical protein